MRNRREPHPWTLAAQADHFLDPDSGAIVPPVTLTTTFARDDDYQLRGPASYARNSTPIWRQTENVIAKLEGAAAAAVFASGMAAAAAVVMTLKPGDHLVVHDRIYWGLTKWLRSTAAQWGLELTEVDMTDLALLKQALRPGKTRLVWLESPSNPQWQVLDIAAIAELGHQAGARVAIDSTVATPVLTQPLALGVDLVMHSATKYLNGHSDVLAGALAVTRADDWWEQILFNRTNLGAALGPFEAWLLLRGLRTLFVRVRQESETALGLAQALSGHPKIATVLYPGLPDHPGHALAARQMRGGFGGMLSIRLKGGKEAALALCRNVEIFHRATSLGSVESLIEHRATVDGEGTLCPDDLIRLSIGLEHPGDLLADLEQGLERI